MTNTHDTSAGALQAEPRSASLMMQAGGLSADRSVPKQVMVLKDATAVLDDVERDSGVGRQVSIFGIDEYGIGRSAHIPFQQHFRGEAAILVDEISRTGDVRLTGDVQMAVTDFRARSVESGSASLDGSHDRFHLKRLVAHGISAIRGRSQNDVEEMAISAHRQKASAGR